MAIYLNVHDKIIFHAQEALTIIENNNPRLFEKYKKKLSNINQLEYTISVDQLGLMIISEKIKTNDCQEFISEKEDSRIFNNKEAFWIASKGDFIQKNNDEHNIDINRKIKLSNGISFSDGDVFQMTLPDFVSVLKDNKVDPSHYEILETLIKLKISNAILSFHYEDERNDSVFPIRKYTENVRPHPYLSLNADLYISDDDFNLFQNFITKNNIEKIEKNIKYHKEELSLFKQDLINYKNPNHSNIEGLNDRILFSSKDSLRYIRIEESILSFLNSSKPKMNFVGNFRNEGNMFINVNEIIEISDAIKNKNELKTKKTSRPRLKI